MTVMNLHIFISFLFCFISNLFAQNLFPIKIDNKYQYKINWAYEGPGGTGGTGVRYGKFSVIEDSVINGEVFYKLDQYKLNFFTYYGHDLLFHYDSIGQKVFVKIPGDDSIRLAVDFNIPKDSSFTSYITGEPINYKSDGIFIDTVFGIPVNAFQMNNETSLVSNSFRFSEHFGIVYHFFLIAEGVDYSLNHDALFSAIIDSIIYNPLTLEVSGLSPLINRPIDTFPFVLNGSYSASIPKLVDSFYVSIIQTRTDTVIRSWMVEFESGQVFVPIYSSMLLVGDKIKLRAKATDESIFENVAYYPDTGYAIITVLPPIVGIKTEVVKFIYKLGQNYPNPFNPSTIISYEIAKNQKVELGIFDVLGNNVAALVDEEKSPGRYEIKFDGSLLSSGVYFYKLIVGDFTQTRKMILSK